MQKYNLSAIKEHNEKRIADKVLVGCNTWVYYGGETVWESSHGMASIETNRPMSKDALFRMASMTKPITGVCIMQLAEKNKLSLLDPVKKYIPEFTDFYIGVKDENGTIVNGEKADREITIIDLLNHSSGFLQGPLGYEQMAQRAEWKIKPGDTLESKIADFTDAKLDCQPGTQSGYGAHQPYDTLGRIVEIVSGKKFSKYVSENITEPLGMTDTTFHPSDLQLERLVSIYEADGKIKNIPTEDENMLGIPRSFEAGSAGILSTIGDYSKFALCLLGKGEYKGVRIIGKSAFQLMTTPITHPTALGFNPVQNWGLSVRVLIARDPVTGLPEASFGWSGAYGTHFFVSPVQGLTAVYCSNLTNGGGSGAPTAFEFEKDIVTALGL